jgi:V8-like Glu-specific endopeptidase
MSPYRSSRNVSAIAALAAIISFAVNPVKLYAQTKSAPPSITNTDQTNSTMAYWTPTRLAAAKPMLLPRASGAPDLQAELEVPPESPVSLPGSAPTQTVQPSNSLLFSPIPQESDALDLVQPEMTGSAGLRFTSSRLVGDAVALIGGEKKYPSTIEGQLRFTVPAGTTVAPGNYVCSATVQTVGVITTAGHCVSDGNGHFFTNWVFTPATRSGSAPFGTWTWTQAVTTLTWFTGGGGVPNAQDVAVIVLQKKPYPQRIGNATGWAGFNIPDLYVGQHVSELGYPCNLDNCAKDHRVDAQVVGGSNNTDVIGSDASGGASGGGWIINYGEFASGEPAAGSSDSNLNSLVAVTSYGPIASGVLYLGASILDGRYVQCVPLNTCSASPTAILNFACKNNPGAC